VPQLLAEDHASVTTDYHVFILSRVREAVDGGMRTDAAVRHGITVTARRRDERGAP
jgi:uncharacterized membrane protein YdfJ with MMPL/SSD domain